MTKQSLEDSLNQLYSRRSHGIRFDLECMASALAEMGNPHKHSRFIHVAGTNGKGSVCAMIESVLRSSGFKTGLYTSPHLIRFNERITVAGRQIDNIKLKKLIDLVAFHSSECTKKPGGRELTFFEFATTMAFEYFRAENTDVVVLETGMGGRLDATNVVDPVVSVITSVSMEHTEYLGKTICAIASEKSGIIKPGKPVVTGTLSSDAAAVVQAAANTAGSPVVNASDQVSVRLIKHNIKGQRLKIESGSNSYDPICLPLHGKHQITNCAVAVAALEIFAADQNIELSADAVKAGLENTIWPGRFQFISETPPVILDGAHNPESAGALAKTIAELFPEQRIGMVLGMCMDKDIDGFLTPFKKMVAECWAVPINNERSRPAPEIAARVSQLGWNVRECGLARALDESKKWAEKSGSAVCVCGSLFLVGETLELIDH